MPKYEERESGFELSVNLIRSFVKMIVDWIVDLFIGCESVFYCDTHIKTFIRNI